MSTPCIVLSAYLAVIGGALGSFAGAVAWRLHSGRGFATGRSRCEECGHDLAARDLIPVVSWILLRGRCRYCGAPIDPTAPVAEGFLAVAFPLSYLLWPGDVPTLVLWLLYLSVFTVLAVHDARWLILPDRLILPLIPVALVDAGLRVDPLTPAAYATHVLGGAAVLGGGYALLHLVSGGRWVGLGDARLGLVAGIVLGWRAAVLALAVANIAGVLFALLVARRRLVPLGPFLVLGFLVAGLVPAGAR